MCPFVFQMLYQLKEALQIIRCIHCIRWAVHQVWISTCSEKKWSWNHYIVIVM